MSGPKRESRPTWIDDAKGWQRQCPETDEVARYALELEAKIEELLGEMAEIDDLGRDLDLEL